MCLGDSSYYTRQDLSPLPFGSTLIKAEDRTRCEGPSRLRVQYVVGRGLVEHRLRGPSLRICTRTRACSWLSDYCSDDVVDLWVTTSTMGLRNASRLAILILQLFTSLFRAVLP